jgi:hypothetical protein
MPLAPMWWRAGMGTSLSAWEAAARRFQASIRTINAFPPARAAASLNAAGAIEPVRSRSAEGVCL